MKYIGLPRAVSTTAITDTQVHPLLIDDIEVLQDKITEVNNLGIYSNVPVGAIITVPTDTNLIGFEECDGTILPKDDYPELSSIIGYKYNITQSNENDIVYDNMVLNSESNEEVLFPMEDIEVIENNQPWKDELPDFEVLPSTDINDPTNFTLTSIPVTKSYILDSNGFRIEDNILSIGHQNTNFKILPNGELEEGNNGVIISNTVQTYTDHYYSKKFKIIDGIKLFHTDSYVSLQNIINNTSVNVTTNNPGPSVFIISKNKLKQNNYFVYPVTNNNINIQPWEYDSTSGFYNKPVSAQTIPYIILNYLLTNSYCYIISTNNIYRILINEDGSIPFTDTSKYELVAKTNITFSYPEMFITKTKLYIFDTNSKLYKIDIGEIPEINYTIKKKVITQEKDLNLLLLKEVTVLNTTQIKFIIKDKIYIQDTTTFELKVASLTITPETESGYTLSDFVLTDYQPGFRIDYKTIINNYIGIGSSGSFIYLKIDNDGNIQKEVKTTTYNCIPGKFKNIGYYGTSKYDISNSPFKIKQLQNNLIETSYYLFNEYKTKLIDTKPLISYGNYFKNKNDTYLIYNDNISKYKNNSEKYSSIPILRAPTFSGWNISNNNLLQYKDLMFFTYYSANMIRIYCSKLDPSLKDKQTFKTDTNRLQLPFIENTINGTTENQNLKYLIKVK